jgi:hypothetical protein
MNSAVPMLVGSLGIADDGGTVLTAEIKYSAGWPRRHSRDVEDIEYIIEALRRIAGLAKEGDG